MAANPRTAPHRTAPTHTATPTRTLRQLPPLWSLFRAFPAHARYLKHCATASRCPDRWLFIISPNHLAPPPPHPTAPAALATLRKSSQPTSHRHHRTPPHQHHPPGSQEIESTHPTTTHHRHAPPRTATHRHDETRTVRSILHRPPLPLLLLALAPRTTRSQFISWQVL